MEKQALKAVHVSFYQDHDEYYEIGRNGVTSIEWGSINDGHMASLDTVRVFLNGHLHSEHVFSNVLGVYYLTPKQDGGGK